MAESTSSLELMTDTPFLWEPTTNDVYCPSSLFNFTENGGNFEDSPLSSPSLDHAVLSSPHLTGSESSPDIFSQDNFLLTTDLATSMLFNNPNFVSLMVNDEQLSFQDVKGEDKQMEVVVEDKKKTRKGRGKKRQRKEEESNDISKVQLSREQLLSFSSQDLDNIVENIQKERPLTYYEEKEVKRQKRLIKNRESAQASRLRKKEYVDQLEAEIEELKHQNSHLTEQVTQLTNENKGLKQELINLHTLVKKTGANLSSSIMQWMSKSKPSESTPPSQKIKAGVCLLIILFSFGLFFGRFDIGSRRSFAPSFLDMRAGSKIVVGGRQILQVENEIPSLPSPQRSLSTGAVPTTSVPTTSLPTTALVSNFPIPNQPSVDPLPTTTPMDSSHIIRPLSNIPRHRIPINGNQRKDTTPSSYHEEIHRFKERSLEHTENPFLMVEVMNESIHHNVSEFESKEVEQWFSERLKLRPNTAFFSVSDFQQIIPANMLPFESNTPFFISLLVPSRTLANQLPPNPHVKVDNSMIEVTCQVMGVNHTSLNLEEVNKIRQVPIVA